MQTVHRTLCFLWREHSWSGVWILRFARAHTEAPRQFRIRRRFFVRRLVDGQHGGGSSRNGSSAAGNGEAPVSEAQPQEIDEDLHNRQLAVYGRETMRRLFAYNVLISGMQGLGAAIGNEFVCGFFIYVYVNELARRWTFSMTA